ncbi:hypothetical protein DVH24_031743 [Malus domestica]|uniref:Uncharacterized protein n=1 Tax=Malus domestica TaxID=3750 RepID=A0A498J2I6_MALDO|nr:hypothetical protein DVH24_031743 [Malus domestica]
MEDLDVDCEKLLVCKPDLDCIKALHFDSEYKDQNFNCVTFWSGPLPHPGFNYTVARYCPFWTPTTPLRFLDHPSWDCSCANSLNFEVRMEPEASELLKCLMLGKDESIYIKLT